MENLSKLTKMVKETPNPLKTEEICSICFQVPQILVIFWFHRSSCGRESLIVVNMCFAMIA